MSRSGALVKNTSILAFGTLCTKGIMFFMTPLYTAWLSVNDYGTFDLITTYSSLAVPFLTLGVGEALFRFLLDANDDESRKTISSTAFGVYCFSSLFTVLLVIPAAVMQTLRPTLAFAIVAYICAELFYNYMMMSMRGLKHLDRYALGNIIFVGTLAVATVVTVYFLSLGLEGILVGYTIGDIVAVAAMVAMTRTYRNIACRAFSLEQLKNMLKYSAPMIPNSISWWIINAFDRTVISIALGPSSNAVYAVASKLSGLCTTIFNVFHLSWQQSASETLNDADRDKYYSDVLADTTVIIASVCILVIGINYWFFDLLFSADYSEGYFVAPILALSILLSVQAQFIGGIYIAFKWSKKNGLTTLIAACVSAVISVAFVNAIGLYAPALSTLAAFAVLFVIRFVDVRRAVKLTLAPKAIASMTLTLGFTFVSYMPFEHIGWVLLIGSCICFAVMNGGYVKKIVRMLAKRH